MKPETHKIDDANKARMAANATKPARSTNGVSFAELMRELRGE
ncbi:hypothetical protein [Marinobacter alexandrii]|nr:hypothetical protein [Marinobacter alexandrii]